MDDNFVKGCVVCDTKKTLDGFHKKYRECRACIFKSVLKRYYNNEDKILEQRQNKCAQFKVWIIV